MKDEEGREGRLGKRAREWTRREKGKGGKRTRRRPGRSEEDKEGYD